MANETEKKKDFILRFLGEFKEFALKGNVMDLAIGVIIGAAFQDIVTSLTENFINPIIGCIGGADVQGKIHLIGDQYINYGAFLTAVINFIIMAFVIFLMMKGVNKLMSIGKKKEEEKKEEPKVEPDVALLTEIRDLLKQQQSQK
jgi:large conductance mechanosensitive channel